MRYLSLVFRCRLLTGGRFSSYKGSMLRGSLGAFLKKTCCTVRGGACEECMLGSVCAYPALFVGKSANDAGNSTSSRVIPFCLVPFDTGKSEYQAGETFSFELKLFSRAIDHLPYYVHAFVLAGMQGMGHKGEDAPGRFELEEIWAGDKSIYSKAAQKVDILGGEELVLPPWTEDDGASDEGFLRVILETPCRFKESSRLSDALPFRQLLILAMRRVRTLWELDGQGARYEDFGHMLDIADSVATVASGLHWKDWKRFSSRQQAYMQLGGLMGEVVYKGRIHPFLPLLCLAEKLHIGKQTSFGLGRIRLEPLEQWTADAGRVEVGSSEGSFPATDVGEQRADGPDAADVSGAASGGTSWEAVSRS